MNTTPVTCPICGEEIHSGNCPHSRRDFVREIERLKGVIKHGDLLNPLLDAIELAEEGISYTGSYFAAKWRMQERLDELKSIARAALEKREAANE